MNAYEQECERWLEIAARAEIGTLTGDIEHMNAIAQALASAPKNGRVGMTGREWILISAMDNVVGHAGLSAHYQAGLNVEMGADPLFGTPAPVPAMDDLQERAGEDAGARLCGLI